METTVNQRLEQFLKVHKISNNEIAHYMNVNKSTVSNWVTGVVQIPVKHLITLLVKYKELNARWLLTGEGSLADPDVRNEQSSQKTEGMVELLTKQLQEMQLQNSNLLKEVGRLEERLESRKK